MAKYFIGLTVEIESNGLIPKHKMKRIRTVLQDELNWVIDDSDFIWDRLQEQTDKEIISISFWEGD